MKTYILALLSAFSVLFTACIENTGTADPTATRTDLSGTYKGLGTYEYAENRFYYRGPGCDTVERIILKTDTFQETFIVTAISLSDNLYKIERMGPYQTFFYEIGAKNQDYYMDKDFSYYLTYYYDKSWESYMKFQPFKDSLEGHMLELGVFTALYEDSIGCSYDYHHDEIYRVKAKR